MPAEQQARDLTIGSVPKMLWLFSIPILISNIFESLNGSINTMWVGRFLGDTALAATANANFIIFLMFSFVFGFGLAATTYVGQYVGRREMESARKVFGAAIGITFLLSVCASLAGWYYSEEILRKLGTPQEVFSQADAYLKVIFIGLPPNLVLWVIMLSLRGIGDSVTAMWYMTITVVLDAILNPLLIAGIWIFPKLGIAGSAYATAAANYIALTLQIAYLYIRKSPLCLRDAQLFYLFAPWSETKRICLKGIPICLQMLFIAVSGLIMISFVNKEGTTVLASYNVCQQLWMYLQMPCMAVGSAVGSMAAQNIGAGLWKRVFSVTSWGMIISTVMALSFLTVFYIFGTEIFQFFLNTTPDNQAVTTAKHIQHLASWSYVLFGVATVVMATLRSNGIVFLPLIVIFLAVFPVRIGFYYLFYHMLGADALWISFPVGAIFCLVVTWMYYYLAPWYKNKLL